jgi:two-component system, cell cycle sensor histidine kinase and response regulator CckA
VGLLPAQPTVAAPPPETARLRGLLQIPRLARGGVALPDLLQAIARTTGEALGFRTVVAAVRRPAWDDFELVAAVGSPDVVLGATTRWAPGQALVEHAATALVVPMLASGDEIVGVLSLDEPVSEPPSGDELDLLLAVATYAGQAIEAAREAAEAARHREALEQLLRVSARLAASDGVDEVLQAVCDGIATALGFGLVVVELADREADRFVPRAASGLDLADGGIQLETPVESFELLFDPQFEREGCYLLTREQALARIGTEPSTFASTQNGRSREAWNRHWLLVPLHDPNGDRSGFVWVDEPEDRLVPSDHRLQALRAFAHQAEAALEAAVRLERERAADEDRRALIDASPVGFVALDAEGRVRAWNPAARRMYGYADAEVIGREPPWIREARLPVFRSNLAELLAGAGELEGFHTDLRADGTSIEVHANSALVRDKDGEPVGFIASMADITAERSAQEALRLSEERQRALISSSPTGIVSLDLQGRVQSWNPAAERMFGWAEAEVVGRPAPWVPEESWTQFERMLEVVAGGGALDGLEFERVRRDGSPIAIAVSAARIHDETGAVTGLIATVADVTERREGEEALRRTQELHRAIVENSSDLIALLSLEGETLFISPSFEPVLGWTPGELTGTPFGTHVHPEDAEAARAVVADAFAGGAPAPHLARVRHRDGHWVHLEGVSRPVNDEHGRPAMVLALARDVTERLRADEERARLEEELRQAQKMEAVGRLAGGIAHDFNNLLTAIGGYGELALARLPEDSPARSNVEEMRRAGERAAALTRQLLAFSRRQVLQPKVIDLNAVVSEVRALLERILGEDVDLRTRLAGDLGSTRADPGQIEQVIMNLAVNARDAMPRGGSLTIETSNVEVDAELAARHLGAEPGPYVLVSVADTGCGMDRETLERAFEPFFTTKPVGQGTGLGLATVYGIVQQTGGHIWAYSEPGRGSTFKLYLPRVWEEPAAAEETVPAPRVGGSETVLLVEDEEIVRSLVREMLEASGYCVLEAPHGAAAIALAEAHGDAIDVLLTDVVMPGVSGQELAAELGAIRPGLRVVFTSGYTEDAIANHGVLRPGTAFLEKPFTAAQLAQKLRSVLDG